MTPAHLLQFDTSCTSIEQIATKFFCMNISVNVVTYEVLVISHGLSQQYIIVSLIRAFHPTVNTNGCTFRRRLPSYKQNTAAR